MSGEMLTDKANHKPSEVHYKRSRGYRVDINDLLTKVRKEKNKEKRPPR